MRIITFNQLREIKNQLPEGSTHVIADKLNLDVQTVRNYFGGTDYDGGHAWAFTSSQDPMVDMSRSTTQRSWTWP